MDKRFYAKLGTIAFFGISIADIIGVVTDNILIQQLFKPLIIPSLMLLYILVSEKRNNWYLTALFFSFLGDVLLLNKSEYFLYGIGAFLITQLIYVRIVGKNLVRSSLSDKIKASLPFLIYIVVLMKVLLPELEGFLIPVLVYGLTLSVLGMLSLLNYMVSKGRASGTLLIGAILFILSDSMIALNKFHNPEWYYPSAIMITYVFSQFLIFRFVNARVLGAKA